MDSYLGLIMELHSVVQISTLMVLMMLYLRINFLGTHLYQIMELHWVLLMVLLMEILMAYLMGQHREYHLDILSVKYLDIMRGI